VLPGSGVGLGQGLVERKSGWIFCSRVELGGNVGEEGRDSDDEGSPWKWGLEEALGA
jgi:hypothetical protein